MFKHLFNPTSIFNELIESSKKCMSISNMTYHRILNNLINTTAWDNSLFAEYNQIENLKVFHIVDEELAKSIYMAIQKDVQIPKEFCNLKFVTVKSKNKAVFAICNDMNNLGHYGYKKYISELIPDMVFLADQLSEILSTENKRVYINYPDLFRSCLFFDINHMSALFSATSLSSIVADDGNIEEIIYNILYHFKSYFKFDDIQAYNPHATWAPKGIFLGLTNRVPMALCANIFNYALDKSSIKSFHDLFKYNDVFKGLELEDNIIFNDTLFTNCLTHKAEQDTDDFSIFVDNDGNTFAKLKDSNSLEKLKEILLILSINDLITGAHILYSGAGDIYLLSAKNEDYPTLKEIIRIRGKSDSRFLSFILDIIEFFHSRPDIKQLHFYENTDFLTLLGYHKIKDNPSFTNLSTIAVDAQENTHPFDYHLVIMLAIREYLNINSIQPRDIYSCTFAKILPHRFIESLISFLETGKYDYNSEIDGDIKELSIEHSRINNIEFVENLPLDDDILLSSLSFFDYTQLPHDFKVAFKRQQESDNADGYIPLSNILETITSRSLNSQNLTDIFFDSNTDVFLKPQKVIISKNHLTDGAYQIIGVLWNQSRLCNVNELIKEELINCKEVYTIIGFLLNIYVLHGIAIDDTEAIDNCLYMNMKTNNIVCHPYIHNYSRVHTKYRNVQNYYYSLVSVLNCTAHFDKNYDIFAFDELVPNHEQMAPHSQSHQFTLSVAHMSKCNLHNHWQIALGTCCVCKKSFLFAPKEELNILLRKDSVSTFFEGDNFELIYRLNTRRKSQYMEQIQIGIENELFAKFAGLKPLKILISPTYGDKKNKPWGILYSDCDFSNIIELSSFKHLQRLKVVLVMYKEILPYIFEGSFICTDIRIFETMFMHKDFKGKMLVPNLPLLECSVIAGDNVKLKDTKIKETLETFSKFLTNYIMGDDYLASKIATNVSEFTAVINDIQQNSFSKDVIQNCLDSFKNYCLTHMSPFATKEQLCPICKQDGITESKVMFENKSFFEELNSIGPEYDGGEANIFPFKGNNVVLKIFQSHVDFKFKSRILAKALEKAPLISQFNQTHDDIKIISVNKLIYMREGNIRQLKGFTQDFVRDSYKISNLKDKNFVKEHGYYRKDIVEILIKVCKGIEFIHSIGGFIGDLNGGNILIKGKSVYFIDIDGMSFDNVKNCVYTNMYIYPPSAESNNITKEDDWYSLAVQAFYYLTYAHPFRGICQNKEVPENEMERMKHGLSVLGPHQIVPPSISIGWDFIPQNLLEYFLATFESSKRESMLEVLQTYNLHLENIEKMFKEIKRNRTVSFNINEFAYIDSDSNFVYQEQVKLNVKGVHTVTTTNEYIMFSLKNYTYVFDIATQNTIKINKTYPSGPKTIVKEGKIYYTSPDNHSLFVDDFKSNDAQISSHTINRMTTNRIMELDVNSENDLFVLVEDNYNTYDIYCNSSMVYSVDKSSLPDTTTINMVYDELSKKWLVLFISQKATLGVVIELESKRISTCKIYQNLSRRLSFYGNVLYYVDDGKICFYNINTKSVNSIECRHVNSDSNISRHDNRFVVLNPTSAYMFEKS